MTIAGTGSPGDESVERGGRLGSISALPIGAVGDEFGLRYSVGFVGAVLLLFTLLMAAGAQPLKWLGRPPQEMEAEAAASIASGPDDVLGARGRRRDGT